MIGVICLDDNRGMLFHHRRQSRDQAVFRDMLAMVGKEKIYMNAYSGKIFSFYSHEIVIREDFLSCAPWGSYCFVENLPLSPYLEKLEALVIYYWNRVYPADTYLDIDLSQGWEETDIKELGGTSHENITRKIFKRKIR